MQGKPEIGADEWQLDGASAKNQAWWDFLREGKQRPGGDAQSVWVSHSVYATETWQGQRDRRLEKTMEVAGTIAFWLRQAAQ